MVIVPLAVKRQLKDNVPVELRSRDIYAVQDIITGLRNVNRKCCGKSWHSDLEFHFGTRVPFWDLILALQCAQIYWQLHEFLPSMHPEIGTDRFSETTIEYSF